MADEIAFECATVESVQQGAPYNVIRALVESCLVAFFSRTPMVAAGRSYGGAGAYVLAGFLAPAYQNGRKVDIVFGPAFTDRL